MRKFLFAVLALMYTVGAIGRQTAPTVQTFGSAYADMGIWNSALIYRGGTAMTSATGEFGHVVECNPQKEPGTQAYEKDCSVDEIIQWDPSIYPNITKDAVGHDSRCYIDGGNQTGRCWAGYFEAGVNPGGEGYTNAVEIGGSNFGADQPQGGTITSKNLLSLVAGEHPGVNPITQFGGMFAGSSKAHIGFIGESAAFTDPTSPVFGVQSNATGQYIATMTADGRVTGSMVPHYFNTNGLDPKLLPAGQIKPGEFFFWGDTSTFKGYLALYNGAGISTIPFTNYIPWTQ